MSFLSFFSFLSSFYLFMLKNPLLTITFKEMDNLDVTAPICDKTGKPIAAAGITLNFQMNEADVTKKAKSIARELTEKIHTTEKKLW